MRRALRSIAVLATLTAAGTLASATPALAQGSAWWRLSSTVAPTLMPRHGEAEIVVTATNIGDGAVGSSREPVTLSDVLPPQAHVEKVEEAFIGSTSIGDIEGEEHSIVCSTAQTVVCTYTGKPGVTERGKAFTGDLAPYEGLRLLIHVNVNMSVTEAATSSLPSVVNVEGGKTSSPPALEKTLELRTPAQEEQNTPTPFGVEEKGFQLASEAQGGEAATQAGSHPFQLTTTVALNQTLAEYHTVAEPGVVRPSAPALPRNLRFKLPPGLIADASAGAIPRCTGVQFATILLPSDSNACPADSAIGVVSALVNIPEPLGFTNVTIPIFNLTPAPGEPARFGFEVDQVSVVLNAALPSGGDYAAEVITSDTDQAGQLLASQVTVWGTPGAASHDSARGWQCLDQGFYAEGTEPPEPCEPLGEREPTAYLTLPTACETLSSSMSGDSWPTGEPGNTGETLPSENTTFESSAPLSGCPLAFSPTLALAPETSWASTPTGLDVGVNMGQTGLLSPAGTAESALQETTVTLPLGLDVNPSSANGLAACSEGAIHYHGGRTANGILEFPPETREAEEKLIAEGKPPSQERLISEGKQPNAQQLEALEAEGRVCPKASKLGEVEVETPLLSEKLTGSVYLAEQNANPFGSLVALYMVFENPTLGVLVKLAGEGKLSEEPGREGQVTTVFAGAPQLSLFSHVRLHLFGGQRGPLGTPARCEGYSASSAFTGWSVGSLAFPFSAPGFAIESGPGGGACSGQTLPFSPSVTAGPTSSQAAAFSPFVLKIGQADGSQPLKSVDVQLPPGDSALLADVTPCPEAQALSEASCGPESEIGYVRALAGLGTEPVSLPGPNESDPVYLTGPLQANGAHGASPFGILARVRAKAGPFDLGYVNVFSTLTVNPTTAAATVASEQVPDFKDGVPVDLKQLEVVVERPGNAPFTLNPTNCGGGLAIGGSLSGYEGGSIGINQPFPVTGCASLPFKPDFTAGVQGHATKVDGTGLTVKVTSAGLGQANIAKVLVQLPKQLPSRLTTIQKACPAATFESTPTPGAACDEGSVIGSAIVHTPILKNPVEGPAYLVSHGGAAFPDIEFVLHGEGITLVIDGHTDIKNGITYSKFESVPDQPFTSFETTLPAGPHSALTANVAEAKNFDLCGEKLEMPTTIVAQNGATIEQNTPIALEGCGQVKGIKTKKLTRAQKLAAALKTCRKRYRRSRSKRAACEKAARRRYGPHKKAKKSAANTQKKH